MRTSISQPTSCADPAILCVIPVYNNAGTIFDVVQRCLAQTPNVLVVDDGSTDADLRDVLKPLGVTVIRHPTNQGKGRALLTAFRYAAEHDVRYVITLDGDGQHFPEDIPKFIPRLSPETILLGHRSEVIGVMPDSSQFGREFSDFWIYVETGRTAHDSQSGFRVYPLHAMLQLKLDCRFYNFEVEVLAKALWAGMRTESVPIRVWYPAAAERVSSFDPRRDNLRLSLLHARLLMRQILPVPHRALRAEDGSKLGVACRGDSLQRSFFRENSGPLGLSVVTALSIVMAIVLWPYGIIPIAYVTIRLHLNKMAAGACLILCSAPALHGWCQTLGNRLISSSLHPHLAWIVGSHLVALPMAMLAAWIVYRVARNRARCA